MDNRAPRPARGALPSYIAAIDADHGTGLDIVLDKQMAMAVAGTCEILLVEDDAMLTTSKEHQDVVKCYTLHANSYLVKPDDFDEFTRMMGVIHEYWVGQTLLPTRNGVFAAQGGRPAATVGTAL